MMALSHMLPQLRFASTIRFVPASEFDALPLEEMRARKERAGGPFEPKDRVRLKARGYTVGAYVCNAGGICNAERVSIFHLTPRHNLNHFDNVERSIAADKVELLKQGKPVRGLLAGGFIGFDGSSERLFVALRELFAKLQIPHSFFFGKRSKNYLNLYYSAPEDTWTITVPKTDRSGDVLTLDDVKGCFEQSYLDPGDTLELNGRRYTAAEFNAA